MLKIGIVLGHDIVENELINDKLVDAVLVYHGVN